MPEPDRRPRTAIVDELAADRLVAVIRMGGAFDVRRLAEALLDARVRFLEITLTTPGALGAIERLGPFRDDGLRVGAGSVLSPSDAAAAVSAGADYLVSPTVEPDVVDVGHRAGRSVFLGGLTPTEVLGAWRAGADVVKVFPGRVATPGYLSDLAGPLPGIPLMPTGNVDPETAPAYLRAGAIAVGVGKALVDPAHLQAGRFDAIHEDAVRWRNLIDGVVIEG